MRVSLLDDVQVFKVHSASIMSVGSMIALTVAYIIVEKNLHSTVISHSCTNEVI